MKFLIFTLSFLTVRFAAIGQLASELQSIFEDFELMGMSVATVCGQDIETYHYGLKDHELGLEIDDSTMYRIASISKLVTATGYMKLYDEGLVNLDEDISNILGYVVRNPNWPDVPITSRMLLSHTSSLQDGTGYSGFLSDTYGNENPPSVSELLLPAGDNYTSNMWRLEQPGAYFTYSNANYGVLATLLEVISGQRFDVYMKNEILNPLQIAGSFNVSDIENISNVAALYRNQGGWNPQVDDYGGIAPTPLDLSNYQIGTNGFVFGPQGGLRCSVRDLAKILVLHQQGNWNGLELLQQATLDLMHTPEWTYNGSNGDNYYGLFLSWGLGVQCTTDTDAGDHIWENYLFRGHAGEAYGLVSDLYFHADSETGGFVFMTNGIWDGYDFGNESAFYTIEESVFQAVMSNEVEACITRVEENTALLCKQPWPNPLASSSKLYYTCDHAADRVSIVDGFGKQVLSSASVQGEIDLGNLKLSAGVYHLTVWVDELSQHFRLVLTEN